jgi:D-glycero-alpha-D-manno-heptose-7-phosphate kinase
MRKGWINKKASARSVTNPKIEEIYDAVTAEGVLAAKLSGAGGGGFMMLMVPPEKRMHVIRRLSQFEGQVSNCHFTQQGVCAWRVS